MISSAQKGTSFGDDRSVGGDPDRDIGDELNGGVDGDDEAGDDGTDAGTIWVDGKYGADDGRTSSEEAGDVDAEDVSDD
jgi:hypothetical protein